MKNNFSKKENQVIQHISLKEDSIDKEILDYPVRTITGMPKSVLDALNYLLAMYNRFGVVYPSQLRIGGGKWSRRTMNKAVKVLSDYGLIAKQRRFNNSCVYVLNEWFKRPEICKLLSPYLTALFFFPLAMIISYSTGLKAGCSLTINKIYKQVFGLPVGESEKQSLYFLKKQHASVASDECTAYEAKDSCIPEMAAAGTMAANVPSIVSTKEVLEQSLSCLSSSNGGFGCFCAACLEKEKKEEEENLRMLTNLKKGSAMNPIKSSVMTLSKLLKLNRVGQVQFMAFADNAIEQVVYRMKNLKQKIANPARYALSIAEKHSVDKGLPINHRVVADLMREYELDDSMPVIGGFDQLPPFEGVSKDFQKQEGVWASNNQQASGKQSEWDSGSQMKDTVYRDPNEYIRLRNLLESVTYNPSVKSNLNIASESVRKDIENAMKLVAQGEMQLRPADQWIEETEPTREQYSNNVVFKQRYATWLFLKERLLETKSKEPQTVQVKKDASPLLLETYLQTLLEMKAVIQEDSNDKKDIDLESRDSDKKIEIDNKKECEEEIEMMFYPMDYDEVDEFGSVIQQSI